VHLQTLSLQSARPEPSLLSFAQTLICIRSYTYSGLFHSSGTKPNADLILPSMATIFADAHRVFTMPFLLSEDGRSDYGEQRMMALGQLDSLVVVVVHLESDQTIRIISMRKGDKYEADVYFEEISRA